MNRTIVIRGEEEQSLFKARALQWAASFDAAQVLDNNFYNGYCYSNYEFLLAAGADHMLKVNSGNAFEQAKAFLDLHRGWVFGYFGYDLKNETEKLFSNHTDQFTFPDLFLFAPAHLITIKGDDVTVMSSGNADHVIDDIQKATIDEKHVRFEKRPIRKRMLKQDYLKKFRTIKNHIRCGDIYELNLCQELFLDDLTINPVSAFRTINDYAKAPFAGFLRVGNNYLLCASPERFMMRSGDKIVSQPIKGTSARGMTELADHTLKEQLLNSRKERAENVMITDLMRNDLAKISLPGTVEVEELFGIYSFPHVHQMISTISAQIHPSIHPLDAIKLTFPMGSMTGAPKVMAMELIEAYENSKRGLFSGSIGYFTPERDFDFNVVIRSMLYNADKKYLSYQAGSAITYHADAEQEYNECLLKAGNLFAMMAH